MPYYRFHIADHPLKEELVQHHAPRAQVKIQSIQKRKILKLHLGSASIHRAMRKSVLHHQRSISSSRRAVMLKLPPGGVSLQKKVKTVVRSQSPLKLTKGSDGGSNETPPRKDKYSEESTSEGEESNHEILYSPQTPQNHEDSFKTPSGSHKNITAQKSEELIHHESPPKYSKGKEVNNPDTPSRKRKHTEESAGAHIHVRSGPETRSKRRKRIKGKGISSKGRKLLKGSNRECSEQNQVPQSNTIN